MNPSKRSDVRTLLSHPFLAATEEEKAMLEAEQRLEAVGTPACEACVCVYNARAYLAV